MQWLKQLTKKGYIQVESISGIILFFCAFLAIGLDNSPWRVAFNHLVHDSISFNFSAWHFAQSLQHIVNNGLMTIFFLVVGLEIKREICIGELNSLTKLALPGFAALGGMIFPALIYLFLNHRDAIAYRGWAIPTATDIAFALGVLALLGKRVPHSLKILLTALAILDDLGAIIIIALFYTAKIHWLYLFFAALCFFILLLLNKFNIRYLAIYLTVGFILWLCILHSGIHSTIAGVLIACTIPLKVTANSNLVERPLMKLEKILHPWVAYLILPLFAFFNAGVTLVGLKPTIVFSTVSLGIALGLLFGKQLGILFTSMLAIKLKCARMPKDLDFRWLYGLALVCGIGFTMSLFIGTLAFGAVNQYFTTLVRIGVILGSLSSGVLGFNTLLYLSRQKQV